MPLTQQQRKALWICGGLYLASYPVRWAMDYSRQVAFYQQQAVRAAQQRSAPKPAAASPSLKLAGIWRGKTAVGKLGVCDVRVELVENPAEHFTGYPSFSCGNGRAPANVDAAILTGALEGNAVRFHIDKTIGTDLGGCAVTSFAVTQFGANQLAAEWQKGNCPGGNVILQRAKS
jgi:hypothetical protein